MNKKNYDNRVFGLSLAALLLFVLAAAIAFVSWYAGGAKETGFEGFNSPLWKHQHPALNLLWYILLMICVLSWVTAVTAFIMSHWMENNILKTSALFISFLVVISLPVLYIAAMMILASQP